MNFKLSKEQESLINSSVATGFKSITESVMYDLDNGGDGCAERIENSAKRDIDKILKNGIKIHLYGESYITHG